MCPRDTKVVLETESKKDQTQQPPQVVGAEEDDSSECCSMVINGHYIYVVGKGKEVHWA